MQGHNGRMMAEITGRDDARVRVNGTCFPQKTLGPNIQTLSASYVSISVYKIRVSLFMVFAVLSVLEVHVHVVSKIKNAENRTCTYTRNILHFVF